MEVLSPPGSLRVKCGNYICEVFHTVRSLRMEESSDGRRRRKWFLWTIFEDDRFEFEVHPITGPWLLHRPPEPPHRPCNVLKK